MPAAEGAAERAVKCISTEARSLMLNAGAPPTLWGDAVLAYTHLKNKSPSSPRNNAIPQYLFTGKTVNIEHIRVWGSVAYAKKTKPDGKFDSKVIECRLVGYNNGTEKEGTKGWTLRSRQTGKYISAETLRSMNRS